MKKLLELKALDTEVRDLLNTLEIPLGIYICVHLHYMLPTLSIYFGDKQDVAPYRKLNQNGVMYHIDNNIDEQTVDEIIAQIEKVLS